MESLKALWNRDLELTSVVDPYVFIRVQFSYQKTGRQAKPGDPSEGGESPCLKTITGLEVTKIVPLDQKMLPWFGRFRGFYAHEASGARIEYLMIS